MLGDSVVNDVLTDPDSAAVLGDRKQQVTRQQIVFNQLRAPFSVGAGKFRLKDAYMNGPMLGATMRGMVDFKAQTVDLGGTYVPLYGLNSALGSIPILGKVLVGRQGEGVVGITFAIKGKLDEPTVLVNPMSVMTPGIFRQIFEFTGSVPRAGMPRRRRPRSWSPARTIGGRPAIGFCLDRPDQGVPLLAERELDHAVLGEVGSGEQRAARLTPPRRSPSARRL